MAKNNQFGAFLAAYTPEGGNPQPVAVLELARKVEDCFHVAPPPELLSFWREVGAGYFGDRELFFLGDSSSSSQDRDVIGWNQASFWSDLFTISPKQGRPIFFAETCFGDQIGFRYRDGECSAILLEPDTLQQYLLSRSFSSLFSEVLIEPFALTERERLEELRQRLGRVPDGWHYAPIISPLVGGTDDIENIHLESALVHLVTAIATYRSVSGKQNNR